MHTQVTLIFAVGARHDCMELYKRTDVRANLLNVTTLCSVEEEMGETQQLLVQFLGIHRIGTKFRAKYGEQGSE